MRAASTVVRSAPAKIADDGGMPRSLNTYDHRLRELVRRTGDVAVATSVGVPRTTAAGWLHGPSRPTVTVDLLSMTEQALQGEVLRLRRQVAKLRAIARILFACLRALDIDLSRRRVPDGPSKARLLHAVERGRDVLRLRGALAMIGLSASRLHAWKRAERGCDLDDHLSCPKTSPHRVTWVEVQAIKEMITSPDYRHVPTGTLAVLAQRIGRVFASATTWRRLVRERGWRRPPNFADVDFAIIDGHGVPLRSVSDGRSRARTRCASLTGCSTRPGFRRSMRRPRRSHNYGYGSQPAGGIP